ncbi:MAG: AIR synthase related protein, partial [Anaerolineae bacterium]
MFDKILLVHGSGGQLSHELVEHLFLKYFDNPILARMDDAAVVQVSKWASGPVGDLPTCRLADFRLAFTTDSYVVSPIFFPGGDIGKLAVCGTINDLAMSGATPLYLSAGFILEEGLELADLERVVASMAATAQDAGVQIVTGDTKVVDHGKADKLFINTAGLGVVP